MMKNNNKRRTPDEEERKRRVMLKGKTGKKREKKMDQIGKVNKETRKKRILNVERQVKHINKG